MFVTIELFPTPTIENRAPEDHLFALCEWAVEWYRISGTYTPGVPTADGYAQAGYQLESDLTEEVRLRKVLREDDDPTPSVAEVVQELAMMAADGDAVMGDCLAALVGPREADLLRSAAAFTTMEP